MLVFGLGWVSVRVAAAVRAAARAAQCEKVAVVQEGWYVAEIGSVGT